jgi:hypothetical protein
MNSFVDYVVRLIVAVLTTVSGEKSGLVLPSLVN